MLQTFVVTLWLLLAIYDTAAGLPDQLHTIVAIGWLIVVASTAKWFSVIQSTTYTKIAGLVISAFVIFVSFGQVIDFLAEISPKFDQRYQNILLVLTQSIVASIFTALVISVPLASIYRTKLLLVVLLSSSPIIIFQVHGIATSESTAAKLILLFEIIFRVIAVWGLCVLASKALTNQTTRTQQSCAGV